jgi:Flp pilus assembly protein TadD
MIRPPNEKAKSEQRWSSARAHVLCGVGEEHLKVGDLDKAATSAKEALTLDKDYVRARVLLAKVLLEEGKYAEAAAELQTAQSQAPKQAEIPYLLGVALEKRDQSAEALACYQQARQLDETNLAYTMAAAEVLAQTQRPEEGLAMLDSALGRSDPDFSALALAGELALLANKPAQAAVYYQRGLDVNPKSTQARESLGRAHFLAGNYPACLEALAPLLEAGRPTAGVAASTGNGQPSAVSSTWIHLVAGDAYLATARPAEAKAQYETACAMEPEDAAGWVGQAKAALALNDSARAILAARKARTLAPENVEAVEALGYALLRQGQTAAAREEFSRAVESHPDNPTLLCLLGRCYWRLGQKAQATGLYRKALEVDGENLLARKLLANAVRGTEKIEAPAPTAQPAGSSFPALSSEFRPYGRPVAAELPGSDSPQ